MEYNKMIELARQSSPDAPGTGEVLNSVRQRLYLRRQRQRLTLAAVLTLLLGGTATMPLLATQDEEPTLTLAEKVSARVDTPKSKLPPPIVGYQHSISNRNIMTLI